MRGRMSYRHAVAVSVGVHALLAAGIVALLRTQSPEPPALRAALDTRLDIQFLDPSNEEPPAPEPSAKIEPDPPMMVEVNPEPSPPKGPEDYIITGYRAVSDGYFSALGVPLASGRLFTNRDRDESSPVAIVNESFVRRFLSGAPNHGLGARTQLGTTPGDDAPVM